MPLYTVSGPICDSKTLVKADSLTELIAKGIKQLNLPVADYSVIYERDGVKVDSDEILLTLAEMNPQNPVRLTLESTVVHLLGDTNVTTSVTNENIVSLILPVYNTGDKEVTEESNIPGLNNDHEKEQDFETEGPLFNRQFAGIHLPWHRFPRELIKAVLDKKVPQASDRRKMVQEIVEYMDCELKDMRRKTTFELAQALVWQFPKSFGDRINGKLIGDGSKTLANQIYSRIMFVNRINKMTCVPKKKIPKNNIFDTYGCAAFQPTIPSQETIQTLTAKKQTLKEETKKGIRDTRKIKELLVVTYPLQRLCFNNLNCLIRDSLKEWPIFTESHAIATHANILFGKDLDDTFNNYFSKLGPRFLKYIEMLLHNQTSRGGRKHPKTKELETWLSNAQMATQSLRSEFAKAIAVFPLLISYFDENLNDLFIVHNSPVTEDSINTLIDDVNTPLLLIEGRSLFEEVVNCYIIINKQICCSTKNVLKGFRILVYFYYIFNLRYNYKIKKTLEFIQRFFFDINPETRMDSNSKSPKKRSRKNPIDYDVRKLWSRMNSTMESDEEVNVDM